MFFWINIRTVRDVSFGLKSNDIKRLSRTVDVMDEPFGVTRGSRPFRHR